MRNLAVMLAKRWASTGRYQTDDELSGWRETLCGGEGRGLTTDRIVLA
ncbi:hypothetical protein ACFL5O_02915 [Myxococcota bacterium]